MLGLEVESDEAWARAAAANLDRLLVDHAHCEMKAATNALSLATKAGLDVAVVRELASLAREELEHFDRVLGFLEARGLALGPPLVDAYAASLRRAQSALPTSPFGARAGIVDRLLVGALIEARSCERFKKLLEALSPDADPALYAFYEELFACEAGHYRRLTDLAVRTSGADRALVVQRLERLAALEGAIVTGLADGLLPERGSVHG